MHLPVHWCSDMRLYWMSVSQRCQRLQEEKEVWAVEFPSECSVSEQSCTFPQTSGGLQTEQQQPEEARHPFLTILTLQSQRYQHWNISCSLVTNLFALSFSLFSPNCQILLMPHFARKFKRCVVICGVFHTIISMWCGHKFPSMVLVEVWKEKHQLFSFPTTFHH